MTNHEVPRALYDHYFMELNEYHHNSMHIEEKYDDEEHVLEALSDEQYRLYLEDFIESLSAPIDSEEEV